jgi:hypothetical protein
MVRKQIYLRPEQDQQLKAQAKRLGVSAAELIRRRITQGGSSISRGSRPEAWLEEKKFIAERARRLPGLGLKRSWAREDAYEERFARYSR